MPIPLILAPVLASLASRGMDLIGSAILAKGKDAVEKTLGVDIEQSLATEAGTEQLRMAQMTHEEKLLEMALEEKKLDFNYYQTDAEDRDSARKREMTVLTSDTDWFNRSIASILALTINVGGGVFLYFSSEADIKYAVVALMGTTLQYYFGSSRSSHQKDATISSLTHRS